MQPSPEGLLTFLNADADKPSPHKEALRSAGGLAKVRLDNGIDVVRANPLTGGMGGVACAVCGALSPRVRACASCQSVAYCGRECQKSDWKAHKPRCKALRMDVASRGEQFDQAASNKVMKWMISMPNMQTNLAKAADDMEREGDLLPIVTIVSGDNHRRAVFAYGGTKTPEDVEAYRAKYPAFADMFHADDELLDGGMRRVIAVVRAFDTTSVFRMRVAPTPH
jgi:hypothetical protein